jgi:predicted ferric reductase
VASLLFDPLETSRRGRSRRQHARTLPSRRPQPRLVDAAVVLVGIGFGVSVGLAITAESWSQLRGAGGVAMFLGSLTGLSGSYLALVMVLLVSRVPFVERVLGQDGLLRWHRRLAPWPISLIVAHAVLLTLGYAQVAHTGPLHELGTLISAYPNMLAATAALGVMVAIGVASIRAIRSRLRRETWWALHLSMYLALALAFAHEIALGPSFVGHPLTRLVWSLAWAGTAGLVLAFRIGLPLLRSLRHRLRVAAVQVEAPGVVSVILEGRQLQRLRISGGQFFEWRFLRRGMWWQAHPFTVSARPQPPYLRLTVKAVGDFSSAVAGIPPGTKVAVEGPYGAFTAQALKRRHVALIAGGIGLTAVRAVLEDLGKGADPVVVTRVSRPEDVALWAEVKELVRRHKGRSYELVGSRERVPLERIADLVPDLCSRDVYVAGPEGFVEAVRVLLRQVGVPADAVHYEVYAL